MDVIMGDAHMFRNYKNGVDQFVQDMGYPHTSGMPTQSPKWSAEGDRILREMGARVRRIRKEKGMTQAQASEASGGIDQGTWSKLENGEQGFTPDTIAFLSRGLGEPAYALFGGLPPLSSLPAVEAMDIARRYERLTPEQKRSVQALIGSMAPTRTRAQPTAQRKRKVV